MKTLSYMRKINLYILKGDFSMAKVLSYLGEIDCILDLIDIVGEDRAYKAWRGKLNYFKDLSDGSVFGVNDYEADVIFDNFEVY